MTRLRPSTIRGASGEQLLMLTVFFGDQMRDEVSHELDRRAATCPMTVRRPKLGSRERYPKAA